MSVRDPIALFRSELKAAAQRRVTSAQKIRRIAITAVSAAAVAIGIGSAILVLNGKQASSPPAINRGTMVEPVNAPAVSQETLVNDAPVVFVGRVIGHEDTPVASNGDLGICLVHYEVISSYRGNLGSSVDLGRSCDSSANADNGTSPPMFLADDGKTYLIFAYSLTSTTSQSPVLTPYNGAVYLVTGTDAATNDYQDTIRLSDLAQRLAKSQP